MHWCHPRHRLSNGERRRKVGYQRAATFNGIVGDPSSFSVTIRESVRTRRECRIRLCPLLRRNRGFSNGCLPADQFNNIIF
jgi:hypothetical protein